MSDEHYSTRGAPWGLQPSLEAMCRDVGVDFDFFVKGQKISRPDTELATELGVSPATVTALREHFEKYGIDSMQGQD